jgi:hypothetical protein
MPLPRHVFPSIIDSKTTNSVQNSDSEVYYTETNLRGNKAFACAEKIGLGSMGYALHEIN